MKHTLLNYDSTQGRTQSSALSLCGVLLNSTLKGLAVCSHLLGLSLCLFTIHCVLLPVLSLGLSCVCSCVPGQYFVWVFSHALTPVVLSESVLRMDGVDTAPTLTLALSLLLLLVLLSLLSTCGGEWNRSWCSCQRQTLSLVLKPQWLLHWHLDSTTVCTLQRLSYVVVFKVTSDWCRNTKI